MVVLNTNRNDVDYQKVKVSISQLMDNTDRAMLVSKLRKDYSVVGKERSAADAFYFFLICAEARKSDPDFSLHISYYNAETLSRAREDSQIKKVKYCNMAERASTTLKSIDYTYANKALTAILKFSASQGKSFEISVGPLSTAMGNIILQLFRDPEKDKKISNYR